MEYNFEESLARLSQEVSSGLAHMLEAAFAKEGYDIDAITWTALAHLNNYSGLYQKDLIKATGRNKVAVTRLIDSLEKKKLVKRKDNNMDKRYNQVLLTKKGLSLYETLAPHAAKTINKVYEGISEKEVDICIEILQKISENVVREMGE